MLETSKEKPLFLWFIIIYYICFAILLLLSVTFPFFFGIDLLGQTNKSENFLYYAQIDQIVSILVTTVCLLQLLGSYFLLKLSKRSFYVFGLTLCITITLILYQRLVLTNHGILSILFEVLLRSALPAIVLFYITSLEKKGVLSH